jgi:hypothetical protein
MEGNNFSVNTAKETLTFIFLRDIKKGTSVTYLQQGRHRDGHFFTDDCQRHSDYGRLCLVRGAIGVGEGVRFEII